jgi:hypothetical protein
VFTIVYLIAILIACAVLFTTGWHQPWRQISFGRKVVIIGLNSASIVLVFRTILRTLTRPSEVDFLCYYLWGRLAGSGLPVYDPESSRLVLAGMDLPIIPTTMFIEHIVDVGPNHTPPALLFYRFVISDMPFGVAHAVWMSMIAVFFAICCFLLARSLAARQATFAALLVPVLALSPVTHQIFRFGQTNFLVMALITTAWLTLKRADCGVWLAVASIFKPFAALLGLHLVIRRNWLGLFFAAGIGFSVLFASGVVLGFEVIPQYLRADFAARTPFSSFTWSNNQSLLAVVLRTFDPEGAGGNPLAHPVFLSLAAILLIVTLTLGRVAREPQSRLAFLLVLCCALLIYPGTLDHYGFFLFLPWLHICEWMKDKGVHPLLMTLGMWGGIRSISSHTFIAILITWGALAMLLLWAYLANPDGAMISEDG